MWTIFKYEDGSNPYTATTEKEKKRIMNKYKDRIEPLGKDFYYIKDSKKGKEAFYPIF